MSKIIFQGTVSNLIDVVTRANDNYTCILLD